MLVTQKYETFLKYALGAYLLFLGWTNLLYLPVVSNKIQLSEIAFLPLVISWLILIFKKKIKWNKPDLFDWAIIAYFLSNVISTIFNPNQTTLLDLVGRSYLVSVYFIFRSVLQGFELPSHNFIFINRILILAIIPALIGYGLALYGNVANHLVWYYPDYPYFGNIFRTKGLMQSPNLLFNLLVCLSLMAFLTNQDPNKKLWVPVFITALLTFAKSWLFLLVSVIFFLPQGVTGTKKILVRFLAVTLFLLVSSGIYVIIKSGGQCNLTENIPTHREATAFYQNDKFCLVKTSYAVLHITEWKAGFNYLPFGAGPGNFINKVTEFKNEGWYPPHMEPFEAHSTLFGTFFELGIPGILSLFLILYAVLKSMNVLSGNQKLIFSILFLFLAQEAIFNDINNFRHIWVILAYFAAFVHHNQPT